MKSRRCGQARVSCYTAGEPLPRVATSEDQYDDRRLGFDCGFAPVLSLLFHSVCEDTVARGNNM